MQTALVKLSDETCTDIHGQPQCTGQPLRSIPSTPWLLRAPFSNEVHRFRATLVNPDLEEAAEVTVTVRLVSAPPGIPPAPTNLRATADASSVTLEWDAVAGTGMRYVVYQHYGGGRHWAREVAALSTTFSGLEADTEYCWDVVTVNAARQESPPSAARCARTGGGVQTGETFRDALSSGGVGPEMVVIPAGSFRMGCLTDGRYCQPTNEFPAHTVNVPRFALSKYEVTFAEWDACVDAGGCNDYRPNDEGWGRGDRPVIHVNWNDAQSYVSWLSQETGEDYRLPSEAEWEYTARAGTTTPYYWGDEIGVNQANCGLNSCGDSFPNTAPVGSFAANAWGLHDMYGNVREWVEDCWHDSYSGAPSDGSAWTSGGSCDLRVTRGSSWDWSQHPSSFRSARYFKGVRGDDLGFRVAKTLD